MVNGEWCMVVVVVYGDSGRVSVFVIVVVVDCVKVIQNLRFEI